MALTSGDVEMWLELKARGVIPTAPRVLEIGEANWYGDLPTPDDCRSPSGCLFEVARNWYRKVLGYRSIVAVDFHGNNALHHDLNEPLPLPEEQVFDIVINTGTAEHVFDQRQLMQTIHERCAPGGLMMHAVPWQGWNNHGFYCYQPCFFADLARANRYELLHELGWESHTQDNGEVTRNVTIYLALRKTEDGLFRVPVQGRYDGK